MQLDNSLLINMGIFLEDQNLYKLYIYFYKNKICVCYESRKLRIRRQY